MQRDHSVARVREWERTRCVSQFTLIIARSLCRTHVNAYVQLHTAHGYQHAFSFAELCHECASSRVRFELPASEARAERGFGPSALAVFAAPRVLRAPTGVRARVAIGRPETLHASRFCAQRCEGRRRFRTRR